MTVKAPLTGYVGGQTAKFIINYENESSSLVLETKVQIIRVNHFNSDSPKRKTKFGNECISAQSFEGCPGKTSKTVESNIKIPSVAPSSDGSCRVLIITYEIHFIATFSGLHSDFKLVLPVVIGTVPYLSPELLTPLPLYEQALDFPIASAPPPALPFAAGAKQEPPKDQTVINRHSIGFGWNFNPGPSTSAFAPSTPAFAPTAPIPTTPEAYDMRKNILKNYLYF